DEFLATVRAERRSRVVFDLEPVGGTVRLTVVHTDFDPGSTVLEAISGGWPAILSNLKTLLETGQTLPIEDQAAQDQLAQDRATQEQTAQQQPAGEPPAAH
ncbi:SRPBCC domain-containing protein, partial [Frankia sp. AvcI1]